MCPCIFSFLGWLVHRLRLFRKARSYSLSQRGIVWLCWYNLFLSPVLGPGPLTPVQDFARHSVRLMDAHLVSQTPARLEAREAQVSLTLFVVIFRSSSLRPGSFHLVSFQSDSMLCAQAFHRSQALLPSCAAGGTYTRAEVHVQYHRHPRCARLKVHFRVFARSDLRFTPVYMESCKEVVGAHLCRFLSVHSVWSQSQVTSSFLSPQLAPYRSSAWVFCAPKPLKRGPSSPSLGRTLVFDCL